jgi:hypothetical protein
MKIAKQMRRKTSPPKSFIIMDEFHLLAGEPACSTAMQSFRRPTGFIATQAVMRSNSGKRLRFLGSTKRADGSPLKPAPKKFIPAQVQRRLAD